MRNAIRFLSIGAAAVAVAAAGPSFAAEKKAAYLGVATEPVPEALGSQLGLADGIGLLVVEVDGEGPSGDALRVHDVLHKINDQLLVSHDQLATLVRSMKPGEKVSVSYFRGGKSLQADVKLGERTLPDVPKGMRGWSPAMPPAQMWDPQMLLRQFRGRNMPGWTAPDDDEADVDQPKLVPVHPKGGKGQQPQAQIQSHTSFQTSQTVSRDGFTVTLTNDNGEKRVKAVDAKGKKLFDGPVNTDKEREKLPDEVKKIVDEMEANTSIQIEQDQSPPKHRNKPSGGVSI